MTKRISIVATAATALLVPALLSACSGGAADDGSSTPGAKDDSSTALVQCMRDRGYDMPDQKSGELQLAPPDGADFDGWQADLQDCSAKHPASGAQNGRTTNRDEKAQQKFAKYAACMREHGITDYPDDMGAQGTFKPSDEDAFSAANDTCTEDVFGGEAALPTG